MADKDDIAAIVREVIATTPELLGRPGKPVASARRANVANAVTRGMHRPHMSCVSSSRMS